MIKIRRNATRQIATLMAEYTVAVRRDRRSSGLVITEMDAATAWSYRTNDSARIEIHDDIVRLYPREWNAALWYEFSKPAAEIKPTATSHSHCSHESTKSARAICRRQRAAV